MKTTTKNTTSTKNCKNTTKNKTSNCGKGGKSKDCTNEQEDEADPLGSYTGNPVGIGKYEKPVQDADDL